MGSHRIATRPLPSPPNARRPLLHDDRMGLAGATRNRLGGITPKRPWAIRLAPRLGKCARLIQGKDDQTTNLPRERRVCSTPVEILRTPELEVAHVHNALQRQEAHNKP